MLLHKLLRHLSIFSFINGESILLTDRKEKRAAGEDICRSMKIWIKQTGDDLPLGGE